MKFSEPSASLRGTAGKVSGSTSDVQQSAEALRLEVSNLYQEAGVPIPLPITDMITLSQSLASIAAPLYGDIHATFASPQQASLYYPQTRLRAA